MLKSFLIVILMLAPVITQAQHLLNKSVNIEATKRPLREVLQQTGKQGGFYFSYNSNLIPEDSLVSIQARGKTVRQVLDMLFDGAIEYKEKEKHIILQSSGQFWYVSGYVLNQLTGEALSDASVYDKQQLVASLTNEQGYFRLKLKDRPSATTINVSKAWFVDTFVSVKSGKSQEVTLSLKPKELALDTFTVTPDTRIEQTWLGRMFLSSKQRMQGINIGKYLADKPYQASITPGLSTHGKMSGQVVNNVSFNLLGGYTAGVNGFEIAGLFNIVKGNVRYAQVAGLFNVAGGHMHGLQIAGVHNFILDSVEGVQFAGLANITRGTVRGFQGAGFYNHTHTKVYGTQVAGFGNFARDVVDGAQIAGFANVAAKGTDGMQIAGYTNVSLKETDGTQISAFFNYTKKLDGVQIALFNLADTSSGYSLGLFSVVLKGYHKVSLSTNEVMNVNFAFRTGHKSVYNIILGGLNWDNNNKVYSYGYGLGSEIALGKRVSINPELTGQYLYLGSWEDENLLGKFSLNLNIDIWKSLRLYAGPSFNMFYTTRTAAYEGYKYSFPNYNSFSLLKNTTSWVGWTAGISIF